MVAFLRWVLRCCVAWRGPELLELRPQQLSGPGDPGLIETRWNRWTESSSGFAGQPLNMKALHYPLISPAPCPGASGSTADAAALALMELHAHGPRAGPSRRPRINRQASTSQQLNQKTVLLAEYPKERAVALALGVESLLYSDGVTDTVGGVTGGAGDSRL